MSRNIYLENTPLPEALARWMTRLKNEGLLSPFSGEAVKITDSIGRITSKAVSAMISSPFYHSSAMDGYAVRFAETFGAHERTPKKLTVGQQAIYVDTGDTLPEGFNAVIMIEDVNNVSDSEIEIISPAVPWQHVRIIGEDIVATELILPENQTIRPVDIGAMLAGGHTEVEVRRKPEVSIIPTGNEVVEPGSELKNGDIIEFNSGILGALVHEWGGRYNRHSIVPDKIAELKKALSEAVEIYDLVIINAGSSAGSEDFTAEAIRGLGEVILHGVNIKPGKPVVLGLVKGRPVIGIPGYPVSAYLTFNLFAKPLLYKWLGIEAKASEILRTKLSRQVASPPGQEEFLRVKVGKVGEDFISTPVSRGAGVLMSLVRADGIVRIPAMSEGLGAGTEVEVELLRPLHDIENTIVCTGSHDNALDLLSNILKKRHPEYSLSSAHVGSMGGLMAIKKGEAHMAGSHLLDEDTGQYNVPFIKKILGSKQVVLVNLVYREQGLLVLKGNPKNIRDFRDLTRNDIVFVNRQSGAGTRLLTDKCLKEFGINPSEVSGYEREEYTHMGVASAVLTGVADTGLAILASARALNLDFIPVAKERYDILMTRETFESEMMQCLLEIILKDEEFRNAVSSLGGYDISDMGSIIYQS